MALAPFFDKAALAAAEVLQGMSRESLEQLIGTEVVEIQVDDAISTLEGRVVAELAVNLLARLYPRIRLSPIGAGGGRVTSDLVSLAKEINPSIDIVDESDPHTTTALVVGETPVERAARVVYVGSNGWIARTDPNQPVGSSDTKNPFGAAAAACLGV